MARGGLDMEIDLVRDVPAWLWTVETVLLGALAGLMVLVMVEA